MFEVRMLPYRLLRSVQTIY